MGFKKNGKAVSLGIIKQPKAVLDEKSTRGVKHKEKKDVLVTKKNEK